MSGSADDLPAGAVIIDVGIRDLRRLVARGDARAPGVSGWSVAMHVHHCCLGMIHVARALLECDSPPPAARPNLLGSLVLRIGRIPRGRGKAPERSLPRPDVGREDLVSALDEASRLLAEARRADPRAWVRHFKFGVLDRDRAFRFLEVHNRHHLRIVSDILAAR